MTFKDRIIRETPSSDLMATVIARALFANAKWKEEGGSFKTEIDCSTLSSNNHKNIFLALNKLVMQFHGMFDGIDRYTEIDPNLKTIKICIGAAAKAKLDAYLKEVHDTGIAPKGSEVGGTGQSMVRY